MIRPALLALCLATPAFAAGSDETAPPTPTQTTTECKKGEVWDKKTGKCLPAKSSALDNDQRFGALRELAYAGRIDEAQAMLDSMSEGESDRVLTYRGFLARKSGDFARGQAFYLAALAQNPDNILVRSYLGQGLAERGDFTAAWLQADEIHARGGAGTWAEIALLRAIATGSGYSY